MTFTWEFQGKDSKPVAYVRSTGMWSMVQLCPTCEAAEPRDPALNWTSASPYAMGQSWAREQDATGRDIDSDEAFAVARRAGEALGYEGEELEYFIWGVVDQYQAETARR